MLIVIAVRRCLELRIEGLLCLTSRSETKAGNHGPARERQGVCRISLMRRMHECLQAERIRVQGEVESTHHADDRAEGLLQPCRGLLC